MISPFQASDTNAVISIWLEASAIAHDFVPRSFWESRAGDMREVYLPQAETYVWREQERVLGFIALLDDCVEALFVAPQAQGRGIGSRLMDFALARRGQLRVVVYKANEAARAFYAKAGFRPLCERTDNHTGHKEIVMICAG